MNTLSPGVTDTPILDSKASTPKRRQALVETYLNMIPIGRLARAENMASAAVLLATDQSSYMTGADLTVEGGVAQV